MTNKEKIEISEQIIEDYFDVNGFESADYAHAAMQALYTVIHYEGKEE